MSAQTAHTTQDHLDIKDIKDNFVVLKNGTICAVLETTAVNFDLLSEIEQDAIIAAFSMLLNSITFPVQVVIRSKKLDIYKYIEKRVKVLGACLQPLSVHDRRLVGNRVEPTQTELCRVDPLDDVLPLYEG